MVSLLDLGEQTLTGVFPRDRATRVTKGPLELVKCHGEAGCQLVQLKHSYDSSEMYGENYGYRSSLNQSMVRHLRAKIEGLLRLNPPAQGDLVLDIGSNDGTSLSFYPETLQRVGMDPTIAKFRSYYRPDITAIADFFSAKRFQAEFGTRKAKIITSIAMFYDLEEPLRFARDIAEVLADDGVWHFEQSYLLTMLEMNAYDTVCHEHLEYYSLAQIQWIAAHAGLKIIDVELNDVNGGSFAVTVAKQASKLQPNQAHIDALTEMEHKAGLSGLACYEAFRERVFRHRDELIALIKKIRAEGRSVLGYGASTKGNVILQFCGFGPEEIPVVAEVNPDKFGSYTPGTHIPIVSEADAHAQKPDYLLVLPWHFKKGIIEREAAYLQRGGKLLFPLPAIEVMAR